MAPSKLILVELNEITWRFIDRLVREGRLPTFKRFLEKGARATPIAVENPPDLDPWISWMTVYTGRPPEEHGVKFLEQPPDTVKGPKIWDIAADSGKTVGVFGSSMSWPPRSDVRGFWVPGPFSKGTETFPEDLRPIQDLNVSYTRAHTPVPGIPTPKVNKLSLVRGLMKCGLSSSTMLTIGSYFARRALKMAKEWEAVNLQPVINADLFEHLWRKFKPDFATFHSNHVAHHQHRCWRSSDPTPFAEKATPEEMRRFGGSIEAGYVVADQLLNRICQMAGSNTTIIVASGLGQQPYVVEDFRDGRSVVRLQNVAQVLELVGVKDNCHPYSVMAPQFNLEFSDAAAQARAKVGFLSAYVGDPSEPLFACHEAGNTLCINVRQKLPRPINWDANCVFPTTGKTVTMKQLCAEKDATKKQGWHEKAGMFLAMGPGIRAGVDIGECSTLDLAPTMLSIMGLPVPEYMRGRSLEGELGLTTSPSRTQVLQPLA